MGLAALEGPQKNVWTPSIGHWPGRLAPPRPGATTAWDTARPSQPLPRTEFCAVHGYIFGWQLVVIIGLFGIYSGTTMFTLTSQFGLCAPEFAIPFPW